MHIGLDNGDKRFARYPGCYAGKGIPKVDNCIWIVRTNQLNQRFHVSPGKDLIAHPAHIKEMVDISYFSCAELHDVSEDRKKDEHLLSLLSRAEIQGYGLQINPSGDHVKGTIGGCQFEEPCNGYQPARRIGGIAEGNLLTALPQRLGDRQRPGEQTQVVRWKGSEELFTHTQIPVYSDQLLSYKSAD
jgi:hypothetical protein